MNYFFFTIFLILLLSLSITPSFSKPQSPDEGKSIIIISSSRRILHQPLFPAVTPPPPPPPHADLPDPDQPFFHELPNGPSPDQGPPTPVANSVASHAHHTKVGIAAAISVSAVVLALAILSALAFYLYNHRSRNHDHSQKLVAADQSSLPPPPPPTFLYIGTVEPSARTTVPINETSNASPYRKLHKPGRRSERYRPSPDLQPLPPLPKPPPPPPIHSPPPMSSSSSSSDDDNFYTPQGSSMSNESPGSRNSRVVPQYSKRISPKPVMIIPSIKHPPPPPPPPRISSLGPLQPSETLPYAPKRPKFAAPPPPPDMAKLRSISDDDHRQTREIPIPPPPPPPPPPGTVTRKIGPAVVEPYTPSPVSKQPARPESMSPPSPEAINSGADENDKKGDTKPKLKPLHWDKVRATSERATVWDQFNSSSFQLNEDAMESLFGCNSANSIPKQMANKNKNNPALDQENRVLDPKKSQNIAILIRALNVTREEVSEALLDGNPEGLGPDLLETLVKMAPTKEEEIKLKHYKGDISKLGSAERFLKGILDIPFAFKRVEAMLYRANFDTEVAYLRKSFRALEEASEELKNSRLFLKLLEAVLRTGNRMNDGTNRGDARAFKLDTLLKLVDVKGADGKTTLLHFVVQEIIRSEGNENPASVEFKEDEFRKQGLHVVSGLSKELGNVKKSAGMDSDVLSGYVSKLETGLEKVRLVVGYESGQKGKFFDSMRAFLEEAVGEITKIKSEEKKALSRVIEVTEYFHGDAAKEEAHPLRIFLIVRDFLAILDNVCRDVGRMQVGATMGAGRSFRMPVVN